MYEVGAAGRRAGSAQIALRGALGDAGSAIGRVQAAGRRTGPPRGRAGPRCLPDLLASSSPLALTLRGGGDQGALGAALGASAASSARTSTCRRDGRLAARTLLPQRLLALTVCIMAAAGSLRGAARKGTHDELGSTEPGWRAMVAKRAVQALWRSTRAPMARERRPPARPFGCPTPPPPPAARRLMGRLARRLPRPLPPSCTVISLIKHTVGSCWCAGHVRRCSQGPVSPQAGDGQQPELAPPHRLPRALHGSLHANCNLVQQGTQSRPCAASKATAPC